MSSLYVRASKRSYLNELKERVINVARGAALMTGTEMEWRYFENPYDDLSVHPAVQERLRENLASLGVEQDASADQEASFGSTDVGNVSHAAATAYAEIATGLGPEVSAHMERFLEGVIGPLADQTMPLAAAAMAMTALDIFHNPNMI